MESNHNPHYEKLDLDPFTFSSPNSTGWSDLEFKSLLEDTNQGGFIEKKAPEIPSPSNSEVLVELSVNDVEAFIQLPQKEAVNHENNNLLNNTSLQQDWRRPLSQPKPKIDQNTFKKKTSKIVDNYIVWLQKIYALQSQSLNNPNSIQQNKIVQQDSIFVNNHSSVPIQKKTKTTKQSKRSSMNLASLLAIEAKKTFPTFGTNHSTDEPLVHLIRQLNKQTIEKLQNRLKH